MDYSFLLGVHNLDIARKDSVMNLDYVFSGFSLSCGSFLLLALCGLSVGNTELVLQVVVPK